jgi:hypothetical protein
MKAAQLIVEKTYEDKKGLILRTIRNIANGVVHFEENGATAKCGAQEFALWAARPLGARKPKKEKKR